MTTVELVIFGLTPVTSKHERLPNETAFDVVGRLHEFTKCFQGEMSRFGTRGQCDDHSPFHDGEG